MICNENVIKNNDLYTDYKKICKNMYGDYSYNSFNKDLILLVKC